MSALPRVGRCQHCQQVRPVFQHDLRFDNGDHIWDTPYPPYWFTTGTWLCAPDYNAAETARANGRTFHVEHELEAWPWREARVRTWGPDGEVLTPSRTDLATCNAIAAASEQSTT